MRFNLHGMQQLNQVLALGAHPDDLELGCGATLAKLARAGTRIRAVIFTDGSEGGADTLDRAEETRTALASLGVHDVVQHAFVDTRLYLSLNEVIKVIEAQVAECRPQRVYTMFAGDRHQDHRTIHEASVVACRDVPQILGYETPSSYPNFAPTYFEDIAEYVEVKVGSLKMHASQGSRLYMQEDKILAAAHFRGVQVGVHQAEAFIPYKMLF